MKYRISNTESPIIMKLKAGYCECDISPPDGTPMSAFPVLTEKGRQARISECVHDQLKISSLTLSDGKQTLAVCSTDTTLHQTKDIFEIRKLVSERSSIPFANIMVCSTHTHSSGENTYLFEGFHENNWSRELKLKIVETIVKSSENLADTDVFFQQIDAPFNHNRRTMKDGKSIMTFDRTPGVTTGPVDSMLSILRFELSNGSSIWWTNWTAHALTTGPKNFKITADYPGALNSMIESGFSGSKAFFTNGCAGNVHPMKSMKEGFDMGKEIGGKIFGKLCEASLDMRELKPELSVNSEILKLRHRKNNQKINVVEACINIGGVKIGFLPGEPYVEFQLAFREALAPSSCFVNGYSNGWCGYIPTEKSFEEGGYGVDYFEEIPSLPMDFSRTQIKPGDGEIILGKLIELANSKGQDM
jgi:hypothetical protein